jgi:septum formation protein
LDNKVLGKPSSRAEAIEMLTALNGRPHEVYTGVCFLSDLKKRTFSAISTVYFRNFAKSEILYYVDNFKPYDKAGAYGAQEWIGYVGIEHIEGSYFNVMGLPIQKLYVELEKFIELNNEF